MNKIKSLIIALFGSIGMLLFDRILYDFFYFFPGACIDRGKNPLDPYDCVPGAADLFIYASGLLAFIVGTTAACILLILGVDYGIRSLRGLLHKKKHASK